MKGKGGMGRRPMNRLLSETYPPKLSCCVHQKKCRTHRPKGHCPPNVVAPLHALTTARLSSPLALANAAELDEVCSAAMASRMAASAARPPIAFLSASANPMSRSASYLFVHRSDKNGRGAGGVKLDHDFYELRKG